MKKPYQKPTVTKIALNYRQAVLAACTGTATSRQNDRTPALCNPGNPGCRRARQAGDNAGAS
jgi:hypothetical protein